MVGYHGYGGLEIFDPKLSFPIVPDDLLGFSQTAKQLLSAYEEHSRAFEEKAIGLSEKIRSHYNKEGMV